MIDIAWIALAFGLGLLAQQFALPPLVGYLVAGFALHASGATGGEVLDQFADMGVVLLLFTIGLKLKVASLSRPQVWGVAGLHLAIMVVLLCAGLLAVALLGVPYLAELDMGGAALLAFALSFSSTVFAVKVLEDKGELGSLYGTIAIGILIMQDLAAVVFLAAAAGHVPSPWALALFLLIPLRPVLIGILERAGHGELLFLFGLVVALGGAQVCTLVGVEGTLGALLLGVMLAPHPKAKELFNGLSNFKDLFLVGFFLDIGLSGAPMPAMGLVALGLLLVVMAKGWLFHRLLLGFRVRARTAFLGGLALASYSEFGLIVADIGAEHGWLSEDWLTVLAIALSMSFVAASLLNARSHDLYERLSPRLCRLQADQPIAAEAEIDPGQADVIILGMGRVGGGAYDSLKVQKGRNPVGVDADPDAVRRNQGEGRRVILGSATDPDFWHRLKLDHGSIRLVLLALPKLQENTFAAEHLIKEGFDGLIGAIAMFPDDEPELHEAGVHMVFNLYAEAGAGFAQHVCAQASAGASGG